MMSSRHELLAGCVAASLLISGCGSSDNGSDAAASAPVAPSGTKATLALLETTDLHTNVMSYDYFKLAEDTSLGFERTATLIAQARKEFPNTLLLDNGDTIQGTALSDYQATVNPIACSETLAIYKVMNAAGYEGGGIGNHEFNFGLPYLSQVTGNRFSIEGMAEPSAQPVCKGPSFPQVLANVYSVKSGKPLFQPYTIINKTVTGTGPDGKAVTGTVKVGIIGFTPPTILSWDKRWLDGKVFTIGVKEAAEIYIPEMRAKGADLVVVISHGGLDNSGYSPTMENGSYYLSQVAGVDAMLIGHSHQIFPNATSTVSAPSIVFRTSVSFRALPCTGVTPGAFGIEPILLDNVVTESPDSINCFTISSPIPADAPITAIFIFNSFISMVFEYSRSCQHCILQ